MYKRKTEDAWEVQGCYGDGGETMCTETSRRDALVNLRLYRAEASGVPYRIKKVRIKIEEPVSTN